MNNEYTMRDAGQHERPPGAIAQIDLRANEDGRQQPDRAGDRGTRDGRVQDQQQIGADHPQPGQQAKAPPITGR